MMVSKAINFCGKSNETWDNSIIQFDDERMDDDKRTEWQEYVGECFDLLVKIAELCPVRVLQMVAQPLNEGIDAYLSLEHAILHTPPSPPSSSNAPFSSTGQPQFHPSGQQVASNGTPAFAPFGPQQATGGRSLNLAGEHAANKLHCTLRDLATMLQLVASLVEPVLCAERRCEFLADGELLL